MRIINPALSILMASDSAYAAGYKAGAERCFVEAQSAPGLAGLNLR
ncbi:MAG: hypothetical protein HOH66_04675 [Rhodospirillaceae bacterium]|jgi:hypothetical protein|nr:hypothetical protein [Rhodospirillaceae bacterium]